jgi:hypothetical protein
MSQCWGGAASSWSPAVLGSVRCHKTYIWQKDCASEKWFIAYLGLSLSLSFFLSLSLSQKTYLLTSAWLQKYWQDVSRNALSERKYYGLHLLFDLTFCFVIFLKWWSGVILSLGMTVVKPFALMWGCTRTDTILSILGSLWSLQHQMHMGRADPL